MSYHGGWDEYGIHEDDNMTVTLSLDGGVDLECYVVAIFPVGYQDYVALSPLNEATEEIFLYRFFPSEDYNVIELGNITDDYEFAQVSDAFDELMADRYN